jgi:hypothetical protein
MRLPISTRLSGKKKRMPKLFNVGFTVEMPHDHPFPAGINHRALVEIGEMMANYSAEVWRAAVSGTVLPGMSGPVNDAEYARSIRVAHMGDEQFNVSTSYKDAGKIEEGYAAYDMKPALLTSPKAKQTKDGSGFYITIPFRSFTTSGVHGTRRNVAPPDILDYVRKHGRFDPDDMRGSRTKIPLFTDGSSGGGTSGIGYQSVSRGEPSPMSAPYTWQSGQWAGMQKTKTSGGATRYMSFRRVSSQRMVRLADGRMVWKGSDPNSWMHPGKEANPISAAVEAFIQPHIEMAMEELFKDVKRNSHG